MNRNAQPAHVVRFGIFEANLDARELRKRGRKIKLPEQPLQVLALLLQKPGEVVSREELREALWPSGTFVDFEHGLNTAIKTVRQALGDSADNPHFIETLPRKGYRFIAPVEVVTGETKERLGKRLPTLLGAAALVAILAAGAAWFWNRPGKLPAAAPVPVPLTSYRGFEASPSFSPDGERVAFSWDGPKRDNTDIYIKMIGEDQPVRLTTDPAPDATPAWSPDGRWIAFVRRLTAEKSSVILIPAIGGSERKLTEVGCCAGYFSRISWHPSGRWLVVPDSRSLGEPSALFLVSTESGEKRRLTPPPKVPPGDSGLAFSPDGRAIAFVRGHSSTNSDLYLLELSESLRPMGEPKRITFWGQCTGCPAWWPDGNSILFASGGSCQNKSLWRVSVSRSARRFGKPERLSFGGEGNFREPAISRKGRIVYMQHTLAVDIWRVDLGGSRRAENLPVNSTRVDHAPQYSPDGKRIGLASNRSGSHEVWVCNADGSNLVQLTSFGGPYVGGPAWSPDGRRIAFGARPSGRSEIYVISSDGGKPVRLPNTQSRHGAPTWSRDGKWIYFSSDRTGSDQVWKVPVGRGEAVQVTKEGGTYAAESPDGKFVYYLRSWEIAENTELWRVPVEGGEEIRVIESVCPQFFSVTKRGIYYFSGWENPSVNCFNVTTRKVETVAKVNGNVAFGFSVSPDSRWLLYATYDNWESDLMLVENFR